MPVRARRPKRRISEAAEVEAWETLFETGMDLFNDLGLGLRFGPHSEDEFALVRDAWQRLGDRFLALRDELGLTLVVIEHHVPLIARVCDYCYCLESGRLIAEGAPDAVTAQPAVVESFLGRGALARVGT